MSDSDENEEKHKNLNQLDGNGDCIVVSAGSVSLGSSIEECGEQISLGPPLLPRSYVTYSDMTDNNNLNKSIGESLGEIFNSNAQKADHNIDSNDCNIKKFLCDECLEQFFKMKGLIIHYKHAHNDDSATTEDKSLVDNYVLVSSSSADELEMLKKNADKCDTYKVKPIDLTESDLPEEETHSKCEERNKTEEEEIEILAETREEEKKCECREPNKTEEDEEIKNPYETDKQTEEKDGETEQKKDIVTEDKHDETEQEKNVLTEDKHGETEPEKEIVTVDKETEEKDGETEQKKRTLLLKTNMMKLNQKKKLLLKASKLKKKTVKLNQKKMFLLKTSMVKLNKKKKLLLKTRKLKKKTMKLNKKRHCY